MHYILAVAGNTFRETLRDKILYNLVLFALLLIGASVLLATLTIGEQARIVKDIGLASINIVGVIIAIFVGIGLVAKEIERRTIYTILARPITRSQFLIGKYLGLAVVIAMNMGLMFGMFLITVWVSNAPISESLFQSVQLMVVESLLIVAVAIFFSTFTSSILSATMTLGVYVIGHLTNDMKAIAAKSQNPITEGIMTAIYYVCPNLEWLNIKGQASSGVAVSMTYQALATSYGLLYSGLLLAAACLFFRRRDF
ncbi:putative ABC transport system, permease component [Nitrospira japonica]|uniref:Putative ABC transport system, permease component n=1 Tax=Nitrospira japonica TaxID=1325564 RepID=A0A1W1I098_9BACT|nr:ABC transporter permease subunit [Nitrospira japonica]SLM46428.1 putative ABC transport system, permease component [Nitrospira japonica]